MKNFNDDIDKVRADIDLAQGEIEWLGQAPIPKEVLKLRASESVRVLSERFEIGGPLLRLANAHANPAALADAFVTRARVTIQGDGVQVTTAESSDVGPMLAWAFGDVLLKRLHDEIDRLDYTAGPDIADRAPRLAELKKALRALEQREEGLICQADEEGIVIARRPDADPEVVLGYDPQGNDPRLKLARFSAGPSIQGDDAGSAGTMSAAPAQPLFGPSATPGMG